MNRFWQKQEEFNVGTIFFVSPSYSEIVKSIGVYLALSYSKVTQFYSTSDLPFSISDSNRMGISDVRINETILNKGFRI